jgi:hypothetical protein
MVWNVVEAGRSCRNFWKCKRETYIASSLLTQEQLHLVVCELKLLLKHINIFVLPLNKLQFSHNRTKGMLNVHALFSNEQLDVEVMLHTYYTEVLARDIGYCGRIFVVFLSPSRHVGIISRRRPAYYFQLFYPAMQRHIFWILTEL